MAPKWHSRFELKPGRWVFTPTPECREIGREIKSTLERTWRPPKCFYHLRAGGHVAAVHAHEGKSFFFHTDIQDFFGAVNRTRATRCMKEFVGYAQAREWANASTVRHPADAAGYVLPYGFVQSPVLASVALAESRLGKELVALARRPGTVVSVYVDDIVVSCDDLGLLQADAQRLREAATASKFVLNAAKTHGPASSVTAFNIEISSESIAIAEGKFAELSRRVTDDDESTASKNGIISYVGSVSPEQAEILKSSVGGPAA